MFIIFLKGVTLIGVLGLQTFLSTRKKGGLIGVLPIISIIGGISYLVYNHQPITPKPLIPFIGLAACLIGLGLLARADYRKKELNKMIAKDMNLK